MGSLVIVLVLAAAWHPAGFIADDNLGAATAEASAPRDRYRCCHR